MREQGIHLTQRTLLRPVPNPQQQPLLRAPREGIIMTLPIWLGTLFCVVVSIHNSYKTPWVSHDVPIRSEFSHDVLYESVATLKRRIRVTACVWEAVAPRILVMESMPHCRLCCHSKVQLPSCCSVRCMVYMMICSAFCMHWFCLCSSVPVQGLKEPHSNASSTVAQCAD